MDLLICVYVVGLLYSLEKRIQRETNRMNLPVTYSVKSMYKLLENERGAAKVLLRLKALIGVRRYMRDEKIKLYFQMQKDRMGKVLGLLDVEMEKHAQGKNKPWTKQDLKAKWDKYMDERFKLGKQRLRADLDDYLPILEANYGQSSNPILKDGIKKLKETWRTEQKVEWLTPG
jgi:hypothetical protein